MVKVISRNILIFQSQLHFSYIHKIVIIQNTTPKLIALNQKIQFFKPSLKIVKFFINDKKLLNRNINIFKHALFSPKRPIAQFHNNSRTRTTRKKTLTFSTFTIIIFVNILKCKNINFYQKMQNVTTYWL